MQLVAYSQREMEMRGNSIIPFWNNTRERTRNYSLFDWNKPVIRPVIKPVINKHSFSLKHHDVGFECSICFDTFTTSVEMPLCSHNDFICQDCIVGHIKISKTKSCPICRTEITQTTCYGELVFEFDDKEYNHKHITEKKNSGFYEEEYSDDDE